MLITNSVFVKVIGKTLKHYQGRGYNVRALDEVEVKVEDLTSGSSVKVLVRCDYCGLMYEVRYADYFRRKRCENKKDSCKNCVGEKAAETRSLRLASGKLKQEEINRKTIETSFEKYGVNSPMKDPGVKEKQKQSLKDNYGVTNPMHSEVIRKKHQETCLSKYGVENVFASEDIKSKIKSFYIKKYGVENPMQVQEIKQKSLLNSNLSKKENGTQSSSRIQNEIHNKIGGKLNYLEEYFWLDIAFPEEKIYIEYNGSGHNIDVKYKKMTEKEFKRKETIRYKILKNKGWKGIFIEDPFDLLENMDWIEKKIEESIGILLVENHNWTKILVKEKTLLKKA